MSTAAAPAKLLSDEVVPSWRPTGYTPSGLDKRADWEYT